MISLGTFDGTGVTVTLHNSWSGAYRALRDNFDPEGEYESLSNTELHRALMDDQGVFTTVTDHSEDE